MERLYACERTTTLEEDDFPDVLDEIEELSERYEEIARCLRINSRAIDRIKHQYLSSDDALEEVIREWLKKNYNVKKFGPPTWKMLAEAIAKPAGGNNKSLAQKITATHLPGSLHQHQPEFDSILMIEKFLSLVSATKESFEERKIRSSKAALLLKNLTKYTDISEKDSFFNYENLECLIVQFGDNDDKEQLISYISDFWQFFEERLLNRKIKTDHFFNPEEFKQLQLIVSFFMFMKEKTLHEVQHSSPLVRQEMTSNYHEIWRGDIFPPPVLHKLLQFFWIILPVLFPITVTSAQQQVLLQPSGNSVRALDETIVYTCVVPPYCRVHWLINGTELELLDLPGVMTQDNTVVGALIIANLTQIFNETTIQCNCSSSTSAVLPSDTSQLNLQGLLSSVIVTNNTLLGFFNIIFLDWTAPYSLDIPNEDPDITYCVDVVDSTSMSALHSQCGLIDTGFNYSIPSSGLCGDYTFTITPVNVVGNGTSATVQYSQALTAPRVSEQQLMPLSSMDGVYTYQMTLSFVVCEGELTFNDDNTGEKIELENSDLIISINTIMFNTSLLNTNRLYSVSVSASNPSGSALSKTRISTHDIFTTSVETTEGSGVAITTSYFTNSTASGVLYIFLFINDDSSVDFDRSVYITLKKSVSLDTVFPYSLQSGQYFIFAYDIESDGVLRDGVAYPASNNSLTLTSNLEGASPPSSPISCDIRVTSNEVSAHCTTGFQMIVQNSVFNKVRKLQSNQTTNGGQLAAVQVEEDGMYYVTICPINGDTGIVGVPGYSQLVTVGAGSTHPTTTEIVVPATVLLIVFMIGLLIVLVIVGKMHRKHTSSSFRVDDIKKCGETAANSSDTAKEDCNNVSTDSGCGTGSDSTNMNSMNSIVVQTADTSPAHTVADDDRGYWSKDTDHLIPLKNKIKLHDREYGGGHGGDEDEDKNETDHLLPSMCTQVEGEEGVGHVFLGQAGELYHPSPTLQETTKRATFRIQIPQ